MNSETKTSPTPAEALMDNIPAAVLNEFGQVACDYVSKLIKSDQENLPTFIFFNSMPLKWRDVPFGTRDYNFTLGSYRFLFTTNRVATANEQSSVTWILSLKEVDNGEFDTIKSALQEISESFPKENTALPFALLRIKNLQNVMSLACQDGNPHQAFLRRALLKKLLTILFTSRSSEFQNKFVAHFIGQDHDLLELDKVVSPDLQVEAKVQIMNSLQEKLGRKEISLQDAREILFQVFAVPKEAAAIFLAHLPTPPTVHMFDPTTHIISFVASLAPELQGLGNQKCAEVIAHSGLPTRPVVTHILLDLVRAKIAQAGSDASLADMDKNYQLRVLPNLLTEFFSRFINDSQLSQLGQYTKLSPALIGVAEIDRSFVHDSHMQAHALDALAGVLREAFVTFPELPELLRTKIHTGEISNLERSTSIARSSSDTFPRFSATPLLRLLTAAIISTDPEQFPHLEALRPTALEIVGTHPAAVFESLRSYNVMLIDLFRPPNTPTRQQSEKIARTTKLLISFFAQSLIDANLTTGSFKLLDGRVDSTISASALLPMRESNSVISSLLSRSNVPFDSSHMQSWEQLADLAE